MYIFIVELSRAKPAQRSTIVKKCGKLPIREIWESRDRTPTDQPPDRPSAPQAYQCKIIRSTVGNQNATQGFIWKEIAWPPGLFERKNNNRVVSFSTSFLMFTLTWITEKELERVIVNKRDEFSRKKDRKIQSGCETIGLFIPEKISRGLL